MVLVNNFPPDGEVADPDGAPFSLHQTLYNSSAVRLGPVERWILDEGNVVVYRSGSSSRLQSIAQPREGDPF